MSTTKRKEMPIRNVSIYIFPHPMLWTLRAGLPNKHPSEIFPSIFFLILRYGL